MKLGGELLGRHGASSCGFRGSIDRSTVYIGRAMNSCSVWGATMYETPNPVCVQCWERFGRLELPIVIGAPSVPTPLSTTKNDRSKIIIIITSENESRSSFFQKMRVFMVILYFLCYVGLCSISY